MKKFKRLIALVTVAMFILSFAAPAAFAADTTTTTTTTTSTVAKSAVGKDIKGTKYEKDAMKLIALGIINGYPDGTVRPEENVTRAQFAAIVAQELKIAEGAAPGATKFKDVTASHWASGLVNVAVGRGIIHGYTDGTFRPEAPVTYAEACAMLTQMLGYGPALKKASWPEGPMSLAASLGITKGVGGGANVKATRGDLIKMAANALEADIMEQDEWGSDDVYKKKDDETILSEIWDITVYDDDDEVDVVDNVPMVDLSGLDPNELQFEGVGAASAATTYEVSPVFNPNDYLGQEVEFWVDEDDDYIYYIAPSGDEEVIFDKIEKVTGDNVELDFTDDDYDVAENANIWVNIDDKLDYTNDAVDLSDYVGAYVKVVLNEDDEITSLVITDLYPSVGDIADNNILKSVDGEELTFIDDDNLDLEDADYAVVRDGAVADLKDLKEGDVINILKSTDPSKDDEYMILASSKHVEGTIEDIRYTKETNFSSYDIYVGGKKYDVAGKDGVDVVTTSDDDNETIDEVTTPDDLLDLVGEKATLYLDVYGNVVHVLTGEVENSKTDVAVLTESAKMDAYADEVKFTVVNAAGTEIDYTVDPDDVDLNGAERTALEWTQILDLDSSDHDADHVMILDLDFDSNGELTAVDVLNGEQVDTADYAYENGFIAINDDDKTITLNGGDFKVTDKTVIFDMTGTYASDEYPDVDVVGWSAIENKDYITAAYYSTTKDELEYIFILGVNGGGNLTNDGLYGIIKGFGKTSAGDDAVVLLDMNGEEKVINMEDLQASNVSAYIYDRDFNASVQKGLKKGQFIRYELDGDDLDVVDILGYFDSIDEDDFSADLAGMDIQSMKYVRVTSKSGTYIKGREVDPLNSTVGAEKYFTINDDTVISDIHDTDYLKAKGASLSAGDLVIIIDTDDDGATADYVVKISEKYPLTFTWL